MDPLAHLNKLSQFTGFEQLSKIGVLYFVIKSTKLYLASSVCRIQYQLDLDSRAGLDVS
jgi:hypothetical protein